MLLENSYKTYSSTIHKIEFRKIKSGYGFASLFFLLENREKIERHWRVKKRGKDEKREMKRDAHVRRERAVKRAETCETRASSEERDM